MNNLFFIACSIPFYFISYVIIELWNAFIFRNDKYGIDQMFLNRMGLFPEIDISFKYAALKGKMLWRTVLYIIILVLFYIDIRIIRILLTSIMSTKLVYDIINIYKAKKEICFESLDDETYMICAFMFYPIYLALYQLILTISLILLI